MTLSIQIAWLFVLAIPTACIAWTVTHEEIFREPREFCSKCSVEGRSFLLRKFFYLFTCEYCFSHYVSIIVVALTGYKLLIDDWRGYVIAGFSIVWIANIYMSLYALIKTDIKSEKIEMDVKKETLKKDH